MGSPEVLLLTHGGWGMTLTQSVQMIIGTVSFVKEVPLTPEMTFVEYYSNVKTQLEMMDRNTIILTDIFGGTTTNVAAKIGRDTGMTVISGLSAPLLIEVCTSILFSGTYNPEEVVNAGREAVKNVVTEIELSLAGKGDNPAPPCTPEGGRVNGRYCFMQN